MNKKETARKNRTRIFSRLRRQLNKKGFNHTHKSTSQHKVIKVPQANTYTLLLSVS